MLVDITNQPILQSRHSPNSPKKRSSSIREGERSSSIKEGERSSSIKDGERSSSIKEGERSSFGKKKRQRLSKQTLEYLEVASEIITGLFIGTNLLAKNRKLLHEKQITHILSLDPLQPVFPEEFCYKVVSIPDDESTMIMDYIPLCCQFIFEVLNSGGRILIHCTYGNSRSSTVTIAYLVEKYEMSVKDALDLVFSKRSIALPYESSQNQLRFLNSRFYKVTLNGTLEDKYKFWLELENLKSPQKGNEKSLVEVASKEVITEDDGNEEAINDQEYDFLYNIFQEERFRHLETKEELENARKQLSELLSKAHEFMRASDEEREKLENKYKKTKSKSKELGFIVTELEKEKEILEKENSNTKQRIIEYKENMVKDLSTLIEDCERHEKETELLQKEKEDLKEYFMDELEKKDLIIGEKEKMVAEKQAQIEAILSRLVRENK